MIKFKTSRYTDRIYLQECVRETKSCIWYKNQYRKDPVKASKVGSYDRYHDTWNEAHQYLMKRAEKEIDRLRRDLEKQKGILGNIKGMKPPASGDVS